MNFRELGKRQVWLITAALAAGLAGGVWAADLSAPLKIYQNDQDKFDFRYPADFNALDQDYIRQHRPGEIVWLEYSSDSSTLVGQCHINIFIQPGSDEKSCVPFERQGEGRRSVKKDARNVNGFLIEDEGSEPGTVMQRFYRFHSGKCYVVTRTRYTTRWHDWSKPYDKETKRILDDSKLHYESAIEIIKSFRFLNASPKTKRIPESPTKS
jgi:hypothetical protein